MIHLHTHSTYSFLDGFGTPEQYIARLKDIGQTAIAITDHGNLFGHRAFYAACKKTGIKFIPGCELYVKNSNAKERYYHLTVLAATTSGYGNLCRLVSTSNRADHFQKRPLLSLDEIKTSSEGLVILSGCFGDGILHRAYQTNPESVLKKAFALKRMFRHVPFYLEVQHHNLSELSFMRDIATIAKIPVCPTVDAHYPRREDYLAEDLMLCIGTQERMSNPMRMKLYDNLWLMSESEALSYFTQEELNVTDEIGAMCSVDLPVLQPVSLPNAREMLVSQVKTGAGRLGKTIKNKIYRERYKYELSIIDKLGLHSYFVIMADTIAFFKARGMYIGPARGSSAGSLICFLLGITEIDPIRHGLSFERFLDLNRKDYPDIDTDFPHDRRESVVEYLKAKYGADRVGRLCSFTTYRGGSVFWDIARIYGFGPDIARQLGKAVPALVNDEIEMQDILALPEVQKITAKWPEFKNAQALEGQVRQLGKHASGFAISPVPLTSVVAESLAGGESVLSVDKYTSEQMGLLKLDILGLTTLDMIQAIIDEVGLTNEFLYRLEPNDPEVFDRFCKKQTAGVFQFEGDSVRRSLGALKIESLDDLSFVNAAARPGASDCLRGALIPECLRQFCYKGKYFVYQEELMAILRFLEFSWDDVTKFRKLVSRKKAVEMEKLYHAQFVVALSKHTNKGEAELFWQTVLKTGSYSFNKSHAVSYAMLAYVSMYLKVKYPNQFAKHYLNFSDDDGKRRAIIREYVKEGYEIKVYDPQKSCERFVIDGKSIVGGLLSLKGIGPAKAEKAIQGFPDKSVKAAISGALASPEIYAPWACLDDYSNKYPLGDLPEGEYIIRARVWGVKDSCCMIEDKNGVEKAYFNPNFVKLKEGKSYRLAISKYKYAKIDSARESS